MAKETKLDKAMRYVRKVGIVRPRDLVPMGIPKDYLRLLHKRGLIERIGRGLYAPSGAEATEHHSLAEACKRVPRGVVCLLSALRFHEMTTQNPFEVWIAIDVKAREPRNGGVQLRVIRFSGKSLSEGMEEHVLEGVRVRVYSPAKTVADCFKFRNKIGRDVAIEALRDCLAQRKATADEIWKHAKTCRVAQVMRPYLEAIP